MTQALPPGSTIGILGGGQLGRMLALAAGRLGFTAPSVRIPPLAFQVWTAPSYSGGVSGALVYPDVFWRHDAVGLRP